MMVGINKFFCLHLVLLFCVIPSHSNDLLFRNIKANGTYIHEKSTFEFPAQVAGFIRNRISMFGTDTNDFGVGYKMRTESRHITVLIYVSNMSSYNFTTDNPVEELYPYSVDEMERSYSDFKLLKKEDATFKRKYSGTSVLVEYTHPFYAVTTQSELYIYKVEDWILKIRVSYPKSISDFIHDDVMMLTMNFQNNNAY